MNMRKMMAAAAICAAAALPSWAADRTISANYALSADETVDGVLTVASGVTVDLNGHNLTVKGLAGAVVSEGRSLDDVAEDLYGKVMSVAAGEPSRSEALGHREFFLGYKHFDCPRR